MAKVLINDSTMTAIADSIRNKTGKTDKMLADDIPSAIDGIESGEKSYTTLCGIRYIPNEKIVTGDASITNPHNKTGSYYGATELETFESDIISNGYCYSSNTFNGCKKLKSVVLTRIGSIAVPIDVFYGCEALETIQIGSIGYPTTTLADGRMLRGTSHALELTIYVDATTLAEVPTAISGSSPWGNPNAIIIYRNSTTGEVITE